MTWTGFAAIFVAFFLTHSIPVRPGVKSAIVNRVGVRAFGIGYSVLSVGMLTLLIWAAGQAPYVELWSQATWHRHAAHLGMMGVCLILAVGVARPNPLSFGGAGNDRFDPRRPGIVGVDRHPVLLALTLWSGVHLLPNGDLAHVILFGVLCGFALAGRLLIDRRKQREMGTDRWQALRREVACAPKLYLPDNVMGLILRLALGVVLFALLLWAHPVIIGVSAL